MLFNKTGRHILTFRSDNGGEFFSNELTDFFFGNGTLHESTIPYTPEQNGVAERMNQTLANAARSMLIHSGFPSDFWEYAFSNACFTRNMCSTSSRAVTPYETWHSRKPDSSILKIFGQKCWIQTPSSLRHKLQPSSVSAYFLSYGHDHGQKGYTCIDLSSGKVITSCNVKFSSSPVFPSYPVPTSNPSAEPTPSPPYPGTFISVHSIAPTVPSSTESAPVASPVSPVSDPPSAPSTSSDPASTSSDPGAAPPSPISHSASTNSTSPPSVSSESLTTGLNGNYWTSSPAPR